MSRDGEGTQFNLAVYKYLPIGQGQGSTALPCNHDGPSRRLRLWKTSLVPGCHGRCHRGLVLGVARRLRLHGAQHLVLVSHWHLTQNRLALLRVAKVCVYADVVLAGKEPHVEVKGRLGQGESSGSYLKESCSSLRSTTQFNAGTIARHRLDSKEAD